MSTVPAPQVERSGLDIRGAVFYVLLLFSIGLALLTLGVLVGDVLKDGAGWVTTTLLFDPPSVDPNIAGARPAILATIYLGILVLLFTVPLGVPTALYLEEYADKDRWYNRFLEVNIQNLAGVPSIVYGILGLAFIVRGIGLGPGAARRGDHPHTADAADGDHRVARGDPLRARLHPPGRLRAGRDPVAGRSPPGDSRRRFPASPPARSSPSRGRSARPRRS